MDCRTVTPRAFVSVDGWKYGPSPDGSQVRDEFSWTGSNAFSGMHIQILQAHEMPGFPNSSISSPHREQADILDKHGLASLNRLNLT